MKQTLKTILSCLLVLTMLFTVAACDESTDTGTETNKGTESTDANANNDFFTDTEVVNSDEETTNDKGNGNSGSAVVPNENKVGGKSWKDVLAGMPKKLRGTKVVLYNWNPAAEYTGAPAVLEQFTKETGIKVEWMRVNYSEYVTKLAALVASKESPDTVRTRLPVPERLDQFQSLDAAKFDFTDAAWDQQTMKDYTVNGVTYATSLKNTHLGSVCMMFYNKAQIQKYDMEDPYTLWKNGKWNMDKFLEMCKAYVKASGNQVACTGMDIEEWLQMHGLDANFAYKNGKFVSLMGDAKLLTLTQQYCDYYNTNKIFNRGQAEIMDDSAALFYSGASVYARKKNSYFGNLKSEGVLYMVPMPGVTGQKYYNLRDEYEAYAIPRGAKNPEAVPYLLRYFLDGSNYDLDTFFCNKQNLEVYNWCMAQENNIWSNGWVEPDIDTGIYKKTANQVKPYLDSINPTVETYIKELNAAMGKLGK